MKQYLLFLLAFCTISALKAQNPPCQAYAAASGWSSTGTVTITAYDSSALPVSSYLWNTGETTEEITVTVAGDYCVTITYEDGCTASDCYYLSDSCYVFAWWYWVDSTTMHLIADDQPYYLGSATYLWSTGETTSSIYTSTPGTYCVTITKDYGCTASACLVVGDPPTPPCQLYFWEVPDSSGNGGVWLKTSLNADGAPAYLWDNGATTTSIHVTEPGTYCVTATNGVDCTKSHCFEMNCKVYVQQNSATLSANPAIGTPPYTFAWSTGETTQTITPVVAGNYWVTVTDATGCTSKNYGYYQVTCDAGITYNNDNTLTANMTGDGPFAYEWSPGGFTTQSIAPTESGMYNVVVTNANGCTDIAYQYWYHPNSCAANIYSYADSIPAGTISLFVNLEGNSADWQVLWNTGETTNFILAETGGEYCVTVVNNLTGCIATSCTWVQPDGACEVHITGETLNTTTHQLTAAGGPEPLVSYAWSTGETTSIIEVIESGYYGVTVTNTAGCTVSGYALVYPANALNVSVYLTNADSSNNNNNNGVHADIYLIEYDPAQGGILTAIDTVATYTWTNWYAFAGIQNIPPGEYLVKAALKPNSNGYDNHLPTYYDEALLWSDATPVTINALGNYYWGSQNISINLVKGQNPGGPGFVGGLVSQGANFSGGGDDTESQGLAGEGDPFPGAGVVLTLPNGTPVAATVTNAEGEYSFENLAWGTYILTLDIPGLTPVSISVTIGPNQPSATSLNFKVDDNSIALPTQEVDLEKPVKIFPNPVRDVLTVELPSTVELTLTNTQGQTVLRTIENGKQARLSLNGLPGGIYFLTVRMESGSQVLKVMIE